jgi:glycosyltransferase involved in cell wall biosynthesis
MAPITFPVYILFFVIFCILVFFLVKTPSHSLKNPFPYSFVSDEYIPTVVSEKDKKTITWIIHMYPPVHNAGAEWMAHCINKYLIDKAGFKVNVIVPSFPIKSFEGVNIITFNETEKVERAIEHSSLILSHLDYSQHVILTGMKAKRPVILVMHNHAQEPLLEIYSKSIDKQNIHLINNSVWIKNLYAHLNYDSIVVYPPVYWKEYMTPPTSERKYVTLINLNKNKGGHILIEIAKRMPDVDFLGVVGGYDNQIKDTSVKNIRYMKNTPNIKEVYGITEILIIPSRQESWGRVAVEAMSSGIPIIANPTPGLKEACGSAGLYANYDNISEWVSIIRELKMNPMLYKKKSSECFARAQELEPTYQLLKLSLWLDQIEWNKSSNEMIF